MAKDQINPVKEQIARPHWVKRKDAANVFGVSLMTIDRWISTGELPARKIGGLVYIPASAVFPDEAQPTA